MKPRLPSLLALLLLLPCARADTPDKSAYPPPAEVRDAFRKFECQDADGPQ